MAVHRIGSSLLFLQSWYTHAAKKAEEQSVKVTIHRSSMGNSMESCLLYTSARRIMICASEDVGNADPHAIMVAVAAAQAVERVGMPESQIILSPVSYTHL